MYTHTAVEDINMLVEALPFQETLRLDVRLEVSPQERLEDLELRKENKTPKAN